MKTISIKTLLNRAVKSGLIRIEGNCLGRPKDGAFIFTGEQVRRVTGKRNYSYAALEIALSQLVFGEEQLSEKYTAIQF